MMRFTIGFVALGCLILAAPGPARASEADGHPISPSCDTPRVAPNENMIASVTMKNDGKWCIPAVYTGAISTPPAHGVIEQGKTPNGYPMFYYKPNPGFTGKDEFAIGFTVHTNGKAGRAQVNVTVNP